MVPTMRVRGLAATVLIVLLAGCGGGAQARPDAGDAAPAGGQQPVTPAAPTTAQPGPAKSPSGLAAGQTPAGNSPAVPPPARKSPLSRPGGAQPPRYAFPIAGCRAHYSRSHHDYPATDIFAPAGCLVVSPVTGVVDEISRVDRWKSATNREADRGGLSVSVIGADGVRYYGSHLQSVGAHLRRGMRVSAGQPLGRVGTSGNARGAPPHLHFGVSWPSAPGTWRIRRGLIYPWPYLDAWRQGRMLSPAAALAAVRRGADPATVACPASC